MKKYTLKFTGHGVQSVFVALNEKSFAFWSGKKEQEDFSIEEYLCNPANFEDIPEEFNFLMQDGEELYWDDHKDIFCSLNSPDLDSCFILVEEVKDDESTEEILYERFQDFIEKNKDVVEHQGMEMKDKQMPRYVMECNSYEKGVVFGDTFEAESFDPNLLKIHVVEGPSGHDYFSTAYYNGEELYNNECFTRGKGMMTWVFDSQED